MTIVDRAYNLFVKHGKLTDIQLQKLLDVNPNSVRPVRLTLERKGLIRRMKEKKKHTRGRIIDSRKGHYTVFKLVKNPKLVEYSAKEQKYSKLLAKIKQLEAMVLALIKKA